MPFPSFMRARACPSAIARTQLAKHSLISAAIVLLISTAQAQSVSSRINIPSQPLSQALNSLALQTGARIVFASDLTDHKTAPAVTGEMSIEQALKELLSGSDLNAQIEGGDIVIRPQAAAASAAETNAHTPQLSAVVVVAPSEGTDSYTTSLSNSATKLNLSLKETPQSISVITHKRMQDQGMNEISQVLDQTTGVHFQNTNVVGSDSNPMYSRGFELQNYAVNGVPRSHRFGFKNDIADTAAFDRVEVVRGASGLLNGVGEPSGAVNMVRKAPTPHFQASVAAKYGSWDFYRAEADISGPMTESGGVRGRFVAAHQDNDTFMQRVNMKKDILYGIAETNLTPNTLVSAGFEYQKHRTTGASSLYSGAPIFFLDGTRTNFGPSTNLGIEGASTERNNKTLFASVEQFFDNAWTAKLDLEHSSRKYDITNAHARLATFVRPDSAGTVQKSNYYGEPTQNSVTLHANGPFALFGREHELVVGGSYYQMKEKGLNYNSLNAAIDTMEEFYNIIETGRYPMADIQPTGAGSTIYDKQSGLYSAARFRVTDAVSVIAGGRLSNWQTRTDRRSTAGVVTRGDTTKESWVFTPYAGIVVDLTDELAVYSSYTKIFQPSTRFDANGQLLDPAEGNNIEVGAKLALFDNQLNLSAAYYRTQKDNVPEYVPSADGSTNLGPTGQFVYEGVDGTKTTGFELEAAGRLTPDWQVSGGYSYTNPKDGAGKPRLTYIPRKTFKLFTSYRPSQLIEGLTVGANLRWQNRIHASNPFAYSQGSFAVMDLMAHYDINREWALTLNLNNLTNKRYYTNINASGWYGEPRSAFVNLRYTFK